MKRLGGIPFRFGTILSQKIIFVWVSILIIVFLSCKEKPPVIQDTTAPDTAESGETKSPYEWKQSGDEWFITLRPELLPEGEVEEWSLLLYYSWTGNDETLPLELTMLESAVNTETKNSFLFFPKEKINTIGGYRETMLAFHSERWKELPREISIRGKDTAGRDFTVLDIKLLLRSSHSDPLLLDPGTMLHYPHSSFRNSEYEIFSHNLYPGLLYLVSDSFRTQSLFLKRLAFFTEKKGFVGRLAEDREISHLRDWFAHDYRAEDLAAFFDLAKRENFPLNESELVLRDLLCKHGIIRIENGSYIKGEGALLGFSIESGNRLPVYYVHETVHGLSFIMNGLQKVFLDFFESMGSYEKDFMRDSLLYREYNVLEDKELLALETAAYLLQQRPEETDRYFREYIMLWYKAYHEGTDRGDEVMAFIAANPGIFGRYSALLQKEFRAFTGLRAEIFYDLLPKETPL